ncbi:hypothetical protein GC167_06005 [bacterium]|nr:hypothetical protein [bacterium]
MPRLNYGLIFTLIAAILIWVVIGFFIAALSASAQPLPVHPWRGYVQACVIDNGERACAILQTDEVFDDEQDCLAQTRANTDRLARSIIAEHPNVRIEAQIACVPDQNLYNADAGNDGRG